VRLVQLVAARVRQAGDPGAIGYESRGDDAKAALLAAAGQAPEAAWPDISAEPCRATSASVSGLVLFGLAVGCFFDSAFCLAYDRTGRIRPRQLALLVTGTGFLTLYLVPFVKYPANPPRDR
jgi:hypothetical protein